MSSPHTADWHEDILGPDFRALDIPLGPDPEGEGAVHATLVRYDGAAGVAGTDRPAGPAGTSASAVLWVHGMTDYFFQRHVAEAFAAEGTAFYALDLRKCGRSRREGQRWHACTDFRHYFRELSTALDLITAAGHREVIPLAHSTGGLIVPLWLDHLRRLDPARHARVGGLILNSPWLDMMYPPLMVTLMRPVVSVLGRVAPKIEVPGGNLGTYGASVHRDHHGEWDFDTTFKPLGGHRKYLGWLREVMRVQQRVHRDRVDVGVPVLTLCSRRSVLRRPFSEESHGADTVLDTAQIQRWAPHLGADVTVHPVEGARHDVFLSRPEPLAEALSVSTDWLRRR